MAWEPRVHTFVTFFWSIPMRWFLCSFSQQWPSRTVVENHSKRSHFIIFREIIMKIKIIKNSSLRSQKWDFSEYFSPTVTLSREFFMPKFKECALCRNDNPSLVKSQKFYPETHFRPVKILEIWEAATYTIVKIYELLICFSAWW